MNDLEIKNASIIDGLGNATYQGNLYVKNGKIVMHHLGELNKEIWEQKFEPHL